MKMRILTSLVAAAALMSGAPAFAQNGGACNEVGYVYMTWTGNTVKSKLAGWMLEQLGYSTNGTNASVALSFQALAGGERDVSFGLWLPTQRSMIDGYLAKGEIDLVSPNLKGAKYTLAIPQYVYEAGVHSMADLDDYRKKFGGKIYGIEAGNDGNQIVLAMIHDNAYGLGDWELVPSSEAGMLAQVQRAYNNHEWIVWLGWAPHPMTINFDMKFLAGGADYWGPNKGSSTVWTITRTGYAWQCPNIGQFLVNYNVTSAEQSTMSAKVINKGMTYLEAGKAVVKNHPEMLKRWFGHHGSRYDGVVMTANGKKKALPVVAKALGIADKLNIE